MPGITSREGAAKQTRADYFFKPDFALLDKAMALRQNKYDTRLDATKKLKAKVNEVPTLEGYDTTRHGQIQGELDTDITNLKSAYNGDLSKADSEFEGFVDKVTGLFDIHGEVTALANRYKGYTENDKRLKEMYEKGDIEEGQYRAAEIELARTREIGIGTDSKQWNGWRDIQATKAIKPEEFLEKFMKLKEADLKDSGWVASKENGKLVYRKGNSKGYGTHEYKTYDSLMDEGYTAYKTTAARTGQLQAGYNLHRWNAAGRDYNTYAANPTLEQKDFYLAGLSSSKADNDAILEQLGPNSTLAGSDLQNYLNSLGANLSVDGKEGPDTKAARQALIDRHTAKASEISQAENDMNNMTASEFAVYDYNRWEQGHIRALVHPYAGAVSYDKYGNEIKVYDDPYVQFELKKRLQQHQADLDMTSYKAKLNMNNPKVDEIRLNGEAIKVDGKYGKNINDYTKYRNDQALAYNGVVSNFKDTLDKAFEADPNAKAAMRDYLKSQFGELSDDALWAKFTDSKNAVNLKYEQQYDDQGQPTGIILKAGEMNIPLAITADVMQTFQNGAAGYNTEMANADQRMLEAWERTLRGENGDRGEQYTYTEDKRKALAPVWSETQGKYMPAYQAYVADLAGTLGKTNDEVIAGIKDGSIATTVTEAVNGVDKQIEQIEATIEQLQMTDIHDPQKTKVMISNLKNNITSLKKNQERLMSISDNYAKSNPDSDETRGGGLYGDLAKVYSNDAVVSDLEYDQSTINRGIARDFYKNSTYEYQPTATNAFFGGTDADVKSRTAQYKALLEGNTADNISVVTKDGTVKTLTQIKKEEQDKNPGAKIKVDVMGDIDNPDRLRVIVSTNGEKGGNTSQEVYTDLGLDKGGMAIHLGLDQKLGWAAPARVMSQITDLQKRNQDMSIPTTTVDPITGEKITYKIKLAKEPGGTTAGKLTGQSFTSPINRLQVEFTTNDGTTKVYSQEDAFDYLLSLEKNKTYYDWAAANVSTPSDLGSVALTVKEMTDNSTGYLKGEWHGVEHVNEFRKLYAANRAAAVVAKAGGIQNLTNEQKRHIANDANYYSSTISDQEVLALLKLNTTGAYIEEGTLHNVPIRSTDYGDIDSTNDNDNNDNGN